MNVIDEKPQESVWDEARRLIAEWERAEPDAAHVILILDGKDTIVSVAGGEVRPSDVAGLCLTAAHMTLDT